MSTDASSTSSTLLRWRPALIALTAVAAGLSIYYLHATEWDRTGDNDRNAPGLRRSNAIRRRSPRLRHARASIAGDRTSASSEATAVGSGRGERGTGLQRSSSTYVEGDDDDEDDEFGSPAHGSPDSPEGGQSLLNLLYHIAEEQARMEGYVHRGVTCNSCSMMPIKGIRYRCANCPDYDLCEICEQSGVHDKTHLFYKIRIPAPFLGSNPRNQQPAWYPGKSYGLPRMVPKELKGRLADATGFERSRIDALWEQFKSLAAVDWPNDPNGLKVAIDRKIWAKYCMPTMLREHEAASALIFDQSFTFYDDNDDGLIGFVEFLEGLAVKQSKDQHEKLRRIFRAHDLDRDGYVGREDIMKLFTSNYSFMRELSRDLFQTMCEEVLDDRPLRETLHSTQPVSSCFTGTIPNGDPPRTGQGKTMSSTGDWIVTDGRGFLGQTDDCLVEDEVDGNKESPTEDQQSQSKDQGHSLISELFDDLDEPPPSAWPPSFVTPDDVRATLKEDMPISTISGSEMRQQIIATARKRIERDEHGIQDLIATDKIAVDTTKSGKLSESSDSLQSTFESTSNEQFHGLVTPGTDSDMGVGQVGFPGGPAMDGNVSREFLYRQIREGFEEVLDPMFKQLEDLHDFDLRSRSERQRLRKYIQDFKNQDGNVRLCEIWLARLLKRWRKGEDEGSDIYENSPELYGDKMIEEMIRQLLKETELASNEWAFNLMDRIYLGIITEEQFTQELDKLAASHLDKQQTLAGKIRIAWLTAKQDGPPHPEQFDDFLDRLDRHTQARPNIEEPRGEEAPPTDDTIGEVDNDECHEIVIDPDLLDDYLMNATEDDFTDQPLPETLVTDLDPTESAQQEIAAASSHTNQALEPDDLGTSEDIRIEQVLSQTRRRRQVMEEIHTRRQQMINERSGIQTVHMSDGNDSVATHLQQAAISLRRLQEDAGLLRSHHRVLTDEDLQTLIEMFHSSFVETGGDATADDIDYELVVSDPTLPQNRPDTVDEPMAGNSASRAARKGSQKSTRRSPAHQRGSAASMEEQNPFEDPDDGYFKVKIKLLAIIEILAQQNTQRGGPALINALEFEQIMLGSKGPRLETIGKWLDLAAF